MFEEFECEFQGGDYHVTREVKMKTTPVRDLFDQVSFELMEHALFGDKPFGHLEEYEAGKKGTHCAYIQNDVVWMSGNEIMKQFWLAQVDDVLERDPAPLSNPKFVEIDLVLKRDPTPLWGHRLGG